MRSLIRRTVSCLVIAYGSRMLAFAQQTATPVFVQPAGSYPIGQLVTITDASPGATIYYGVHGVIPTTRGTKYTGPFAVADVETVRAIAVAPGFTPSEMAVAKYTAYPTMTTPVLTPPPGAYYTLPDVTITGMGSSPGYYIYWTIDGSAPTQSSLRYETPIRITNGTTVSAMAVQPYYFQSPVVSGVYQLKVQTPVITPSGGSQLTEYSVTISDATPGASIFYTTDGSTPTAASTPYGGAAGSNQPIVVSTSLTLKAIATLPDYANSDVASAPFLIAQGPQTISTIAGTGVLGYSGDGGPATKASMDFPVSIALDNNGNLYIADQGNAVVRKIALDTGIITTVAGTSSGSGYTGDGGPATKAGLDAPTGVAVDSLGNLYIVDEAARVVRKVDAVTGIITTVAGNLQAPTGEPGAGELATSFGFTTPYGVALNSTDDLFISDKYAYQVFGVDHASGVIRRIAGAAFRANPPRSGSAYTDDLFFPTGLGFDTAGHLYLANSGDSEVDWVDLVSENIYTAAGIKYTGGYSGNGGLATAATLDNPMGVAVDTYGNLYIADTNNHVIREVFAGTLKIQTIAGTGQGAGKGKGTGGYGGDGGLATAAQLNSPEAVAVDADGNIYIADTYNHVIRKVTETAASPSTKKQVE